MRWNRHLGLNISLFIEENILLKQNNLQKLPFHYITQGLSLNNVNPKGLSYNLLQNKNIKKTSNRLGDKNLTEDFHLLKSRTFKRPKSFRQGFSKGTWVLKNFGDFYFCKRDYF